MTVLIIAYSIMALLFAVLFWQIAIHSKNEVDHLLGWFGDWSIVTLACVVVGLLWPIVLLEIVRREIGAHHT